MKEIFFKFSILKKARKEEKMNEMGQTGKTRQTIQNTKKYEIKNSTLSINNTKCKWMKHFI